MASKRRKAVLLVLKIAVAGVLLWWVLRQVQWPQVVSALKTINIPLLLLAVLGTLVSWTVLAVRFWYLLRIQEIRLKFWEALRLTFLGQFFGYVVPGTVGGDLVKAYYVAKHTPRKAAVLVTVFVDRVLGLVELVVLAAVMISVLLAAGLQSIDAMFKPLVVVGVVAGGCVVAGMFLLSSGFRRIFHLQKLYQKRSFAHHIEAAGDAAMLFRKRLPSLIQAVMLTVGSQLIWITSVALIGLSLGLSSGPRPPIPFYSYYAFVPVIYILAAVPATPGSLGVLETLYVWAFPSAEASLVVLLALIARLVPMLCGIPGAVVAITGPKFPKADQMQAELAAEAKV